LRAFPIIKTNERPNAFGGKKTWGRAASGEGKGELERGGVRASVSRRVKEVIRDAATFCSGRGKTERGITSAAAEQALSSRGKGT